jgi:hypothetical protein
VRTHARTRRNISDSHESACIAIFAARRTLATAHDATLMPTCAAPAQERRLFKGPKLRVIKAGPPSRGGPGFASRLRTRAGAGIRTVLNGKCGKNTTCVPPVHPTLILMNAYNSILNRIHRTVTIRGRKCPLPKLSRGQPDTNHDGRYRKRHSAARHL